jgi:hypothetical protein
MNDAARMPEAFPGPVGNPHVVNVLRDLLAQAERGEIVSIAAVVAAGPGRAGGIATSGLEFELYLGLHDLADRVRAATKPPAGKPAILMPGRRM